MIWDCAHVTDEDTDDQSMKEKCACVYTAHTEREAGGGHSQACSVPGTHGSVAGSHLRVRTFSEEKLTRKIKTLKVRVSKHPDLCGQRHTPGVHLLAYSKQCLR